MTDYSTLSDSELNALVAEKCMGWERTNVPNGEPKWGDQPKGVAAHWNDANGKAIGWELGDGRIRISTGLRGYYFNPCTDPRNWMEVVEQMRASGWRVLVNAAHDSYWCASFESNDREQREICDDDSIGRAVSIAALRAVEDEER